MPVQLYLDEDVDPLLAQVLRIRGINCLSTHEANHRGKSDAKQLAFAASQQRAFLTFNVKDYVRLSQDYYANKRTPLPTSSFSRIVAPPPASRTKTWP